MSIEADICVLPRTDLARKNRNIRRIDNGDHTSTPCVNRVRLSEVRKDAHEHHQDKYVCIEFE